MHAPHLHAPHLHIPGHHHHETAKEKKARLRAETLAKMRLGAEQHHNLEEHHDVNIRRWHRAFAHVAGERADAHVLARMNQFKDFRNHVAKMSVFLQVTRESCNVCTLLWLRMCMAYYSSL